MEPSVGVKAAASKPGGVIILALLQIVTGVVFLLGGGALVTFASGGSALLRTFGLIHFPIAVSFITLGVASLTSNTKWLWKLGLAVAMFSVADDVVAFVSVPLPFDGIIGTLLVLLTALAVLLVLSRNSVRTYFIA